VNYRGFGWAWLVLGLLVVPASAAPLAAGALTLDAAESWLRASPGEEAELASVILRHGAAEGALEIILPGHRPRPKTDAARFIEQLERSWRRRYGDRIGLDWLEAAGSRWRVCRRPSRSGESHVFELVTVHGGEAYQIMVAAPPGMDHLPDTVRALLAGAVWTDSMPEPVPAPAVVAQALVEPASTAPPVPAVAQAPTIPPEPVVAPAPAEPPPPASLAPVPAPAEPEPVWRLLRQVVLLPGTRDWAALADAEGAHLGGPGMVDGLGLSARENGLDGFLEGFVRRDQAARKARCPFRQQWRVDGLTAPAAWQGAELSMPLAFRIDSAGEPTAGGLTARFEWTPACAPAAELANWLDALPALGRSGLAALDKMACAARLESPGAASASVSADDFPAWPDECLDRPVTVAAPMAWQRALIAAEPRERRHLVLTVRFRVTVEGSAPGDALWREAVVVFVYGADV
jgi:hypothetical protein